MISVQPVVRDLVLLGGGHSHVIVIRQWAMNPIPGVRVTLVSSDSLTPYSGMLPGLVAGHYSVEDTHIDLPRLCRWAGVRFVRETASGVDAAGRRIRFETRPDIEYDVLSVDTGGAPRLNNVPGALEFATPVKPVSDFFARWQALERRARESDRPLEIGVVGAGAGGFEILLAMNHRLNSTDGKRVDPARELRHRLHWLIRGTALDDYPARVQTMGLEACDRRGVTCHHDFDVVEVRADGVVSARGEMVSLDATLWCTEAMAATWPAQSGLDCDERGFIRIGDTLQSLSHPEVFAAGDVAIQVNHPRPRAGVFAVRQGPVLAENLRSAVLGEPLREHRPQEKFLTLLSMGDRSAIGNKGPLSIQGPWVWRWKHWIDSEFMNRFNKLPPMLRAESADVPEVLTVDMETGSSSSDMRCAGCGAKVPADLLESVIAGVVPVERQDIRIGLEQRGDVAVVDTGGRTLAQTVDQLRSFVSDPWLFGRIATIHALSDLYAAGCEPQSAQIMVTLPWGRMEVVRRELAQVMAGVSHELESAHCALTGGHTAEGPELSLGMVVNGYPGARELADKGGARVGDRLILTKSLGTGVILAAEMQARVTGPVLDGAMDNMLLSNARAAQVLLEHGVHAMTDVTGFGLLGHVVEILQASRVSCQLSIEDIPMLPGALKLSREGIRSSLFAGNASRLRFTDANTDPDGWTPRELLLDPQTSGGLVAAVPAESAAACLEQLNAAGYADASVIGIVSEPVVDGPMVRLQTDEKGG